MSTPAPETIFIDKHNVKITNLRAVLRSNTYAISDISAVEMAPGPSAKGA
jgi:hypothetical protein